MEEKVENKDKKVKTKKDYSFNTLLSFVAYIGIGCISVALILTLIFKGNTKLANAFSSIGEVVAYIICICLAFNWVKHHTKIPWIVCYVVFVVTIVVLFILNI